MSVRTSGVKRVRKPFGLPRRWLLRGAIIAIVAACGYGVWHLRSDITEHGGYFVASVIGAQVSEVLVEGVTYTNPNILRDVIGLQNGDSLVSFDVADTRARIEALDWVRLATVRRQLPSTVHVEVYEYVPVALLEDEGESWVIDNTGHRITAADERFAELPRVSGDGAPGEIAALLVQLAAFPALRQKLVQAEYIGQRRWDVTFAPGVRVQLPEQNATVAVQKLLLLDERRGVLQQTGLEIDLRLQDRIVIREPANMSFNAAYVRAQEQV